MPPSPDPRAASLGGFQLADPDAKAQRQSPDRLNSGGLKAAVAGDERKAKVEGSCGDDAVRHVRNDGPRDFLKSVCDRGIHRGDESSYARVAQRIAEAVQGCSRDSL